VKSVGFLPINIQIYADRFLSVFSAIRISLAISVSLPLSSLCINRRLYRIASGQARNLGRAEVSRTLYS